MKIKQIMLFSASLLFLANIGSCSSSPEGKNISRDEFLNIYDNLAKKRGDLRNFSLANYSFSEDNLIKITNQDTLLINNENNGELIALGDNNISIPVAFESKPYFEIAIRKLISENEVKETYTIKNNNEYYLIYEGDLNLPFKNVNFVKGSLGLTINDLGFIKKIELTGSDVENNYHLLYEFSSYESVKVIEKTEFKTKYKELLNKRISDNTIYHNVNYSGFLNIDNDEGILKEKTANICSLNSLSYLNNEAKPLFDTLVTINNEEALNNFLDKISVKTAFGVINDKLCFYTQNDNKDIIYLFDDYGYTNIFYTNGEILNHDITAYYHFKNYSQAETYNDEETFVNKYDDLIKNRGTSIIPPSLNGIGYISESEDGKKTNKITINESSLSKEEKNIESTKVISYYCPFFKSFTDEDKLIYDNKEVIRERIDLFKSKINKDLNETYLSSSTSLTATISGISQDNTNLTYSSTYNYFGYLTSLSITEINNNVNSKNTKLTSFFVLNYAENCSFADIDTVISAYSYAIKKRENSTYLPNKAKIYTNVKEKEMIIYDSELEKNEIGFFISEIIDKFNFYQGYNTVENFRTFISFITSQGLYNFKIDEKHLYLEFADFKEKENAYIKIIFNEYGLSSSFNYNSFEVFEYRFDYFI